jgi:hypothetical protein
MTDFELSHAGVINGTNRVVQKTWKEAEYELYLSINGVPGLLRFDGDMLDKLRSGNTGPLEYRIEQEYDIESVDVVGEPWRIVKYWLQNRILYTSVFADGKTMPDIND